jgi:hypothetical protein
MEMFCIVSKSELGGGKWSASRLGPLNPLDRRRSSSHSWSGRCSEERYFSIVKSPRLGNIDSEFVSFKEIEAHECLSITYTTPTDNSMVNLIITTRVEAGSNTSTVTLRVVGGDEKGSLKSQTVKYGRKSQGTRTRERLRWQGPAAHTQKTDPSSHQRG